jgi:large subunit ribosomal protein L6e
MGKKTTAHKPRNYEIAPDLMRFSRARMFQRRGVYKKKKFQPVKKTVVQKETFVVKKIGGETNGGERKVLIEKPPKALGAFRTPRRKSRSGKEVKTETLRPSITPGTVLILLAGRHKGKRCVFLKQLAGGLLLVTGPLKLNNCPLRRIAQCFVIATKTKLDISSVSVPDRLNDEYFKRARKNKRASANEDTDIFATNKQEYVVSDQRKADQKEVDGGILEVIRKHRDKKTLFGYLGASFAIRKGEFPHRMVF